MQEDPKRIMVGEMELNDLFVECVRIVRKVSPHLPLQLHQKLAHHMVTLVEGWIDGHNMAVSAAKIAFGKTPFDR